MRKRRIFAAVAALPLALAGMGIAHADNIQDSITDTGTGISLIAGSGVSGSAGIRVVGNNADGSTTDPNCNWDSGESPLVLDVVTPTGVTANPDPVSITACGVDVSVTFTAGASAVSGAATVTIVSSPAGGGGYNNQVSIPITVTRPNTPPAVSVTGVTDGDSYVIGAVPTAMCDVTDPDQPTEPDFLATLSGTLVGGLGQQTATCDFTDDGGLEADTAIVTYTIVPPPNTPPVVAVTGVEDGARYEIGAVPTSGCDVFDAEDVGESASPVISGTLSHGLGAQTVTCSYTDAGDLSDSDSVTYTIVDTGDPTISHTLSPAAPNSNGWFKGDVVVEFSCDDGTGSGIQSCAGDTTLGEGENQSVTGTATDWGGNTASDFVSNIDIDQTAPDLPQFFGGPAGDYYFGSDPAAPTCESSDDLSGLESCVVTGGGTSIGEHHYTATATDHAGNVTTASLGYKVLAWDLKGFYAPVDMSGVWNTVKGGSTVPLKFEVFAGQELTTTSVVKSFTQRAVSCPGANALADAIEVTTTGGTDLRYDATGGQFIQNWKTPTGSGLLQGHGNHGGREHHLGALQDR